MGRAKIVDEQEVLRWFDEGKTYREMVELYEEKYQLQVGHSMFGNFRRRRGLERRISRDDNLIPWEVKPDHRYKYPILMLRAEARRREGKELSEKRAAEVDRWLASLERDGAVLHYDPDTEQGWWYVHRTAADADIIRKPARKTTLQPRADL